MVTTRPLVHTQWVETYLDATEDQVVDLAEEGLLGPVVNIALTTRNAERRFLQAAVIYWASTQAMIPLNADVLISHLVPDAQVLNSISFRRTLSCCQDHVFRLVKMGHVKLVPGQAFKKGPGGSPKLDRASCLAFVKSRLV